MQAQGVAMEGDRGQGHEAFLQEERRGEADGRQQHGRRGDGERRAQREDQVRDGQQAQGRAQTFSQAVGVREAFQQIAGTDYGMSEPRWFSRFSAERRQARDYRSGRVLLVGDAAHVNSPIGGQGMNTGIQDAANLGWKLAAELHGWAPSWLLDTYHSERHPVGSAVLDMTDHLTGLVLSGSRLRLEVNRRVMAALLHTGAGRRRILGRLSGLEFAYPPDGAGAHPLAGRRAPDGPTDKGRLYEVLRAGTFVLLSDGDVPAPWRGSVRQARPLQGTRPEATLIRPDGYVAWAGDRDGIEAALVKWRGLADRTDLEGDRAAT